MGLIMTAKKLTAEELAVKMEMGNHDWADDAANMLRDQQVEIEKLGSELDRIVELYTDKAIENEELKKIVEDTIGQAFYEDDYHKAQAEIEKLNSLLDAYFINRKANIQYTRSEK